MSDSSKSYEYEVAVVGGGPAGMTATLYSTRLGHDTAVVNRCGGRAAMMQEVHNLLGVKEETSGGEFLGIGQEQLEAYGCDIHRDMVTTCSRPDSDGIRLAGNSAEYEAKRVVLATGSTMSGQIRHSRGRVGDFITVCTVTPTCSLTSRCT